MASLAAAMEMQRKLLLEQKAEAAREKKRNVADPSISVNDICNTLDAFMKHHKCNDLWRLICPPQGLINVTWQTPVNPEWVVKLSGVAFDIFDFAKNTKLLAVRVKKALAALHDQKNLTLPQHLGQKEDAMDHIDIKLRIGLNMFRELKKSSTLRNRVFRVLTCDEQTKVQMCLDKITLEDAADGDGAGSPPAVLALPAPEVETPERSVAVVPVAKESLRRSLQFSPSSLATISETPAIFGKILGSKSSLEEQPKKPAQALTDAEILAAAAGFVPSQVEGKKKQIGSKQKTNKKKKKTGSQKKESQKKACQDQKKKKAAKSEKNKKTLQSTAMAKSAMKKPAKSEKNKRTLQSTAMAKTGMKKPADVPLSPDYVIVDKPSMEDGYRNLYVSRHWHRANQLAKKCGLSLDERKIRRKKAAKDAAKIWDDLHPN